MDAALVAVITYAVLSVLWGAVLAFYLRSRRLVRGDALIAMLLTVLALDAFKSLVESIYFGILWGGNYGVLPASVRALGEPGPLTAVKVLNVVVAVTVLARLARTWVPTEMRRREAQRTELEQSLVQARANEETLRLAITASSEYIWDADLRTGRLDASPQTAVWLGYPPDEWPPSPWHKIVHEDDLAMVASSVTQVLRGEIPSYRVRHRVRRKDGTVLHVVSNGVVARNAKGRAVRFVGAVRDISREVAEEAGRLQAQKLEGLGLLAGGIAHDFNNLLTVVRSSVELVIRRGQVQPAGVESLENALQGVTRATTLTRQLLTYAGRAPAEHQALDLNEVVSSMGELLAVSISRKVTLVRSLGEGLPSVRGDIGQLQQVVMNLITNAAEAIGDREGTIDLTTEHRTDGAAPSVRLSVRDTGSGMSPEVQARIFDPFFSTKGTGRGLGMAVIAGIVKAHGGTIEVESTVGVGTTFVIDLPALDKPAEKPAVAAPSKATEHLGLRVLLVDDEKMLRRAGRRILEMLGCTVDEADNGRVAVDRVREQPQAYDLVLMDVTMPEMSGLEAAELMATLNPSLPVILSSGYSSEARAVSGDRFLHLAKPYSVDALVAAIHRARGANR